MYAVISTGGKQYRVAPGDEVIVERLAGAPGDELAIPAVLVVADDGAVSAGPALAGRTVRATITGHDRGPKIRVSTYKNKTRQRRAIGHRQERTTLRIDGI